MLETSKKNNKSEEDMKYIEQTIHNFNKLMIKLDKKLTETHILLKTIKEITKNSK